MFGMRFMRCCVAVGIGQRNVLEVKRNRDRFLAEIEGELAASAASGAARSTEADTNRFARSEMMMSLDIAVYASGC